jgi:hypothetical protein
MQYLRKLFHFQQYDDPYTNHANPQTYSHGYDSSIYTNNANPQTYSQGYD